MAHALYRMRKPVTTTGGGPPTVIRTPRDGHHQHHHSHPHPHGHYGSGYATGAVHKSEARPPNEPVPSHDLGETVVVRSTKRNLLDQLRVYGYSLGKRIGEGSYSKVYYAKHVGDPRPDTPQCSHATGHAVRPPKPPAPVPPRSAPHPHRSGNTTPASTTTNTQTTTATPKKSIACKVIDARCTSAEYMDKFLPRELEIIKHLNHPHIVSVYTILEVGPFICCFMDFCPFGDLLDRIRFRGPLTAAETQLYFAQLASAVHYLHSENIAHRDIKCENVLLHSRHCVKLTDFGFSRPLLVNRCGGSVDYSETFCGSAAYAAPEVLKGIAYDPRRYDMWSLGCVLFIMATGSMPYDDENIATTIRRQEQHHIAYPSDVTVDVQLRDLIGRLLDPDVEGRLSVEQLMEEPWVNEEAPDDAAARS